MAAQPKNVGYPAEIVPGRLYFVYMPQNTGGTPPGVPRGSLCYWLDHDLIYEPFCADFGPCNLAHTWRFCQRINHLLREGEARGVPTYLLVGPHPHKRANAAALVGIHSVLYLGKRAEEAYAPLRTLEPFAGFRDASCGVPSYTLGVADVIRGAFRAKEVGFIKWGAGEELDLDEYEHYEQVENGDLNWIVPGKLMAFSGPSATPKHYGGWRTFTPEDYVPYFRTKGVTKVVRLNKKMYEAARFTAHGIGHHELYFPDGTCPPEPVLYRFLELAEREPGALAIHCKAGLGRTGVLICSYMIKHFAFTAEEAMGYIRICRPGSVIGPQQHYLMQYAPRLLHEGRVHRAALAHAAAGGSPNVDAALRTAPPARRVINLVATSRAEDLAGAERLRRSARISSGGQSPADDSHVKSSGYSSVEGENRRSFAQISAQTRPPAQVRSPPCAHHHSNPPPRRAQPHHLRARPHPLGWRIPGQALPLLCHRGRLHPRAGRRGRAHPHARRHPRARALPPGLPRPHRQLRLP
jgi:cell division cycle 14